MTEYLRAGCNGGNSEAGGASRGGMAELKRRRTLWRQGRPGRWSRGQRKRVLDAGPQGFWELTK